MQAATGRTGATGDRLEGSRPGPAPVRGPGTIPAARARAAAAAAHAAAILARRDPDGMRILAAAADTPPEVLSYLATVDDESVRAEIAANRALPAEADRALAGDESARVRAALAARLAEAWPGEHAASGDRRALMRRLAADPAPEVRAALARDLCQSDKADPELLAVVAGDEAAPVRRAALAGATALDDGRLAAAGDGVALRALAARPRLPGPVAARIARCGDADAVLTLIDNHATELPEETVEWLIAHSAMHPDWRRALARRPGLPLRLLARMIEPPSAAMKAAPAAPAAVHAGSGTASGAREGVAAATSAATARTVPPTPVSGITRAEKPTTFAGLAGAGTPPTAPSDEHLPFPGGSEDVGRCAPVLTRIAERLSGDDTQDALSEAAIAAAACLRRHAVVWVALAIRAGTDYATVHRIMVSRAPRTVMALAWKAGLSPRTAVLLQRHTAAIPDDELMPLPVNGRYPFTAAQMEWLLAPYRIGHRDRGRLAEAS